MSREAILMRALSIITSSAAFAIASGLDEEPCLDALCESIEETVDIWENVGNPLVIPNTLFSDCSELEPS